jgi:hypothetical protein
MRPCAMRPCALRPCALRPCALRPCALRPCALRPSCCCCHHICLQKKIKKIGEKKLVSNKQSLYYDWAIHLFLKMELLATI